MADFNLPFASNGERREPTADEQESGFGCGPASLPLFNWMFYALQAEINNVMIPAGLTPSNGDMTQLYQAIAAMIAAATGGGDTSTYLLMTQARARLPIYPEVQNVDGHFGVTSPGSGQIRIPAGVTFQHRGIFPLTTVQTDFATDASKTYHLRWNPTDGFVLKDVANAIYNPGTLPETSTTFDTSYDDMLVARIITNSSNVPTITNLENRQRLKKELSKTTYETAVGGGGTGRGPDTAPIQPVNWARQPTCNWQEFKIGPGTTHLLDGVANVWFEATRYTCRPQVVGFYSSNSMSSQGTVDGSYRVILEA
ncbi:hypothetical protein [Rhizobium sp. MHM7A]|uniref:hypothetical protein n=1 Tax=Rhizobium sp. MHM7A TaxID=2583233 RepID=UPI001105C637|nr:hypothetical protein [Rhizobium sp. MHM7A]TLX12159.1 hypothetical protein FFR93_16460 [Rhizobium sp. MHM7A]